MFQPKKIIKIKQADCEVYLLPFDKSVDLPEDASKKIPNFGKIRKLEWYYGRNLLAHLCSTHGIQMPWYEIELEDFTKVNGIPGHLSLSHTKGLCALGWSMRPVGIDIEIAGRRMPEGSEDKFINDGDIMPGLSPLEKWCAKEAAFKALRPYLPKALKEVVIKNREIHYHGLKGIYSFVECEGHLLALAQLSGDSSNETV